MPTAAELTEVIYSGIPFLERFNVVVPSCTLQPFGNLLKKNDCRLPAPDLISLLWSMTDSPGDSDVRQFEN